jgi:hypothetical protein
MTDPTSLPGLPPPPGQYRLRDAALDWLKEQGFLPGLDEDGDIAVTVQAQQLFVRCQEGDVNILRVFGQWRLDEVTHDELSQLRAANAVTGQFLVVKTTVTDDVLVVSAEHLITDEAALPLLVTSSFELVLAAVTEWNQALTGTTGSTGQES